MHVDDPPKAPRILVAEDDAEMRNLLAATLRRHGYEVVEARNGEQLLDLIGSELLHPHTNAPVDLVISDVRMPGWSGLDVLAGLRSADWATPFIVITAFGDFDTHAEARRLGALAVFDKPFDLDDLCTVVLYAAGPPEAL